MESNLADHITKVCRHALKHFSGGAGELVLQGVKGPLHGDVHHSLHLEEGKRSIGIKSRGQIHTNACKYAVVFLCGSTPSWLLAA